MFTRLLPTNVSLLSATASSLRSRRVGFCSTRVYNMPSNNPEAKNAAGLVPHESKLLKERKPESHEESILYGIKQVLAITQSYMHARCSDETRLLAIHFQSFPGMKLSFWLSWNCVEHHSLERIQHVHQWRYFPRSHWNRWWCRVYQGPIQRFG